MYMFSKDTAEDLAIKQKLLDSTVSIDLLIEFTDKKTKTLTSKNILLDTLELTNSICDDSTLKFGGCISSQLSISVFGVDEELNNREIKVYINQKYLDELYPSNSLYPQSSETEENGLYPYQIISVKACIFTGTIDSSKRQQNRSVREIIAFDNFYVASRINLYNWFYNFALFSPKSTIASFKEIIVDICEEKGLIIDKDSFASADDDSILSLSYKIVQEVFDNKELSVLDLLQDYCECSAKFAYCDGDGNIQFKQLPQKGNVDNVYNIDYYSDLTFEDYTVKEITKVRFPYNKNLKYKAVVYNKSGKQNYYDSDNKFTTCNTSDLTLSNLIKPNNAPFAGWAFYDYRPLSVNIFSRWWIEVGDTITLATGADDVKTITTTIFTRTISGTAGLSVTVSTNSSEYQGEEEKEWLTN